MALEAPFGAIEVRIVKESCAHRSALRAGDVLAEIAGRPVADVLAGDPLEEFYAGRPKVDVAPTALAVRPRDRVEQDLTSEEEQLAKTNFCSGCGSTLCMRRGARCRAERGSTRAGHSGGNG